MTYWDVHMISGWWFGTFGLFFHILGMSSSQLTKGMSSSQLTNSIIFQRGRSTTNQIWIFELIVGFPSIEYFQELLLSPEPCAVMKPVQRI